MKRALPPSGGHGRVHANGNALTVTPVGGRRYFRALGGSAVIALACAATQSMSATVASADPTPVYSAPAPPSSIGDGFVQWIAVSPIFIKTGTVAVTGSGVNCGNECALLWISRDGGASWHRAGSHNWQPGRLAIAVDGNGKEILYGAGPSHGFLVRSDDYGEHWVDVGKGGMPSVLPTYATDGGLVVASPGAPTDYLLRKGAATEVSGSNNTGGDLQFMPSPDYPSGGAYSPALLVSMDPHSHLPIVWHCAADFTCTRGNPIQVPGAQSAIDTAGTLLYPSGDYAQKGAVFADTPLGVEKSMDGGNTFTPLAVAPTDGAYRSTTPMMSLAPGYREAGPVRTAYVAVFQAYDIQSKSAHTGGGVYRTTDGGATWVPVATAGAFAGGAMSVAVAPNGRLFAGYYDDHYNGGLLCSTDGGATWEASCPPVGDHPVASEPNLVRPGTCTDSTCTKPPAPTLSSAFGRGSSPKSATSTDAARSRLAASPARAGDAPWLPWVTFATIAVALLVAAALINPIRRRVAARRPPSG